MAPTLAATLGVKGHRPTVGTRGCKDLLYVFAVVTLVTAVAHADTRGSPKGAKRKTGLSKARRMPAALACHLRHGGRMSPREKHGRVVVLIGNAPWHRGRPIDEALRGNPHLELKRLPAYSPQLNPIERFWKAVRRRATHNRLFDKLADLKTSLRARLSYFQTVRHKVKSVIEGRPKRSTTK